MVQSFKDNPNLKQAVVIGILKVAQESIFSDFNNPAVSTLLDPEMEDCFGFTEPEVEAMADYYGLGDKMDGIREWYNGYIFGEDTVIYNPWSIVNYLRRPSAGLRPYWVHTSAQQDGQGNAAAEQKGQPGNHGETAQGRGGQAGG